MRRFLSAVVLFWITASKVEAGPAWQEEWDRVLVAAKKEGSIAILGTTGTDIR